MQKEFLKEAIISITGKQAEDIVNYIDSKKYTNEFLIAKKLGITINQLRNILYKLSDEGIVSSVRKKDKKKGWYTYFWKIEILRALDFLKKILEKRIDQMNHQIESRERKNFYICKTCNVEFNEENALLQNFTCNECGNVFAMKDNTKFLKDIKKNLDKQEKELQLIKDEMNAEKEKLEKKRFREIKKEKKMKKKKMKKKKSGKMVTKKETKKTVKNKLKGVVARKSERQSVVVRKKKTKPKKKIKKQRKLKKPIKRKKKIKDFHVSKRKKK